MPVTPAPAPVRSSSRLLSLLGSVWFWFAVALLIRLLYLLEQAGTSPLFYVTMLDEQEVMDSARQILTGAVPAEPYFKAPGFSWLVAGILAVAGDAWPWVLRMLQHTAGALLAPVVGLMAGCVVPASARKRASAFSAALLALYAPMIRLESNVSLDFWAVFFQTTMLLFLIRWTVSPVRPVRWLVIAGLLAAASWITRPTITLLLPVLSVGLVIATLTDTVNRKVALPSVVKTLGAFLVPVIFTMAAVTARNAVVGHEAMVMPWQGGFNFYEANRPGASGRYLLQKEHVNTADANPTRAMAIQGYLENLPPEEVAEFQKSPRFSAVNSYWFDLTVGEIKAAPASWVSLMGKKFLYLVSDKEIFNYEDYDLQRSLSSILPWLPGRFGVIFPLALASLAVTAMLRPRRKQACLLLWIYVVTLGGAIALYYVSGRMRMPIAPPMIALAGVAIGLVPSLSRSRKLATGALFCTSIILSWGDWWGVRSESMAHADLARMSNAAWHRNQFEQALDFAMRAERIAPEYPTIPRLKAQAYYGLGMLAESAAAFEESIRVLGDETSRRNLLVVREELTSRGR